MTQYDALYNLQSLSDAIQATKEALNITENLDSQQITQINVTLDRATQDVQRLFSQLSY